MKAIATGLLLGDNMLGHHLEHERGGEIFLFVDPSEQNIFSYAVPALRGHRYSILPALSLDGILHLEVLDHAFTGVEFQDFIRGVLDQMQPWPLPNSVLVMDNARIHTVHGICEMIEERYAIFSSLIDFRNISN